MEKIIYTNRNGDILTFDSSGEYFLMDFTGMESAEILPSTTTGYQQMGQTVNEVSLGVRIITLTIGLFCNPYEKKRNLDRLFNPLIGESILVYENDYQSKMIKVIPSATPHIVKREGKLHFVEVELTAFDPFFYDVTENALQMGDYQGGLAFPIASPYVQFAQKGDISRITNSGDYITPVRAEFRGDAINPVLTLTNTGERIKVNTTLAVGEKLWIDTAYGNKTVFKQATDGTKTSAYNLISLDTKFFQLAQGENTLTFSSDGGQPVVYLYWRNRYLGV